jgi:hypothetical protein
MHALWPQSALMRQPSDSNEYRAAVRQSSAARMGLPESARFAQCASFSTMSDALKGRAVPLDRPPQRANGTSLSRMPKLFRTEVSDMSMTEPQQPPRVCRPHTEHGALTQCIF